MDVSPKREALRYKFNQGHHSKGFPMLNSAFGHASDGIVDCGLWVVETKMPGGFTLQEVNGACFLKPEPKSGEG